MTEEVFDMIRNCFSCDAYVNDFLALLKKEGYSIIKNSTLTKKAGHIIADELIKEV